MENLQLTKQDISFDSNVMFEIILAAKARYKKSKQLMYDALMVEELYDIFFSKENASETQIDKDLDILEENYCGVLKKEEKAGLVAYDYENESFYTTVDNKQADITLEQYSDIYGEDKVDTIKKYVIKYNK